MKVNLDIKQGKESTGMFSSILLHQVIIKVEFSREELAAIEKLGLSDKVFYEWPTHPKNSLWKLNVDHKWHMLVKWLITANANVPPPGFDTLPEAQSAMTDIEQAFKNLKQAMTVVDQPTTKTLEL